MGRLNRKWIKLAIVGALPMTANAQAPFNYESADEGAKQAEIGGTAALDIITLKATGPGAPLRYGNVIVGSERVQLDHLVLKSGQDYMMDYGTGVVYLKRAQKAGQILTVSYRYKEGDAPKTGGPMDGFGAFKYTVAPGSLTMMMGFGMAERSADGGVMQSNVFGWQNNFKFGQGGSLSGLYVYGDRQQTQNEAGLQMNLNAKPGDASKDEGKSQLIMQSLKSELGNTKISVDYQDISQNFTNFGTVKQSGVDDATIAKLTKERGLTRTGFSMTDLGGISTSFRDVKDSKGAISWKSFGYNQGALKVNFSEQKVDKAFARFKDIAEADREQLLKEAGMTRQNLGAEFAAKSTKLSFSSSTIKDEDSGKEIKKLQYGLDTSNLKLDLGQQEISEGFSRMPSLLGDEQAVYGKEAGLKRQWTNLQTSLFGAGTPIKFSQTILGNDKGEYKAQDFSMSGKTWSLEHSSRKVDSGFTRLDALQEQPKNNEIVSNINTIAKMYGVTNPNHGAEKAWFLKSSGIERSYSKLNAEPFRDWKFSAERLNLDGDKDGGSVDTINLSGKNANFYYRKQQLGAEFTELTRLMDFERQRLGMISGLERTDFGMNLALGGNKKLDVSQMSASAPAGDASRTSLSFKDTKIDVQVTTREVSSGFTNVNQLVDPEKDLLASMTGFKQTEGKISWKLNATMDIQAYLSDAYNTETEEARKVRNMLFNWKPKAGTHFSYTKYENHSNDPLSLLFANEVERLYLAHNFGRMGNIVLLDEKVKFDGEKADQPDWHKQHVAYEAKVNDKTTLKTEQTRKNFDNGDKENISANTVSTELSKRVGVSVTDIAVDRQGDDRDEKKRNYGFWFDLGNGLRMSYGYVRHLNGEDAGSMTSTFAVGQDTGVIAPNQTGGVKQGAMGNFMVGGGYGVNTWDNQEGRTQAFSNVNITTAKPFRMLGFSEVKFNLGVDTAADNANWLKENRIVGITGKLAGNTVGFEYKSQIHPSGYRGIDRTYVFQTDQGEKNWLKASMKYKVRTLPWDEIVAIRDFNISAKPSANTELTHQMVTNPEVFDNAAFLGSKPQAARVNKWKFDYKSGANFTIGGFWDELLNEQNKTDLRTAGLTMKFWEGKGSPLTLMYGVEQSSNPSLRRTTHRYSLRFDQKPGPNQMFSLFVGNVSYQHSILDNHLRNNWTARLDYQLRF